MPDDAPGRNSFTELLYLCVWEGGICMYVSYPFTYIRYLRDSSWKCLSFSRDIFFLRELFQFFHWLSSSSPVASVSSWIGYVSKSQERVVSTWCESFKISVVVRSLLLPRCIFLLFDFTKCDSVTLYVCLNVAYAAACTLPRSKKMFVLAPRCSGTFCYLFWIHLVSFVAFFEFQVFCIFVMISYLLLHSWTELSNDCGRL